MRCDLKKAMELAQAMGHGLPAFNVFGYEDAKAVIRAAEANGCPVVLMTNKVSVEHMGIPILAGILLRLADSARVPVCVHLDHSTDLDHIREAVAWGYTSVMLDGSQLPYEENVRITREAVTIARPGQVSVEAEIGSVGYSDNSAAQSRFTDPEEAAAFVKETQVDALAVAVGTVHRMEHQGVDLQFGLLKEIHSRVPVPLVIHGSTGVTDRDLKELVRCGACKINMGTVLRITFGKALREQMEADAHVYDRIALFRHCMDAVEQKAAEKIGCL